MLSAETITDDEGTREFPSLLGLSFVDRKNVQYAWPFPSITWPEAPVTVISVPVNTMGSKSESRVVPKVVSPAKVRDAPVWRARLMVLDAGADTPERRILVQDFTADEMLA